MVVIESIQSQFWNLEKQLELNFSTESQKNWNSYCSLAFMLLAWKPVYLKKPGMEKPRRSKIAHAHQSTLEHLVRWAWKFTWEILLGATPGNYSWELLLGVTTGSYSWELLLGVTPGNYSWELILGVTPGSYSRELFLGVTPESYSWELHLGVTPGSYSRELLLGVSPGRLFFCQFHRLFLSRVHETPERLSNEFCRMLVFLLKFEYRALQWPQEKLSEFSAH